MALSRYRHRGAACVSGRRPASRQMRDGHARSTGSPMMQSVRLLRRAVFVLLLLAGSGHSQEPADPQALAVFAATAGLRDVAGFVEAVQSLEQTGQLPPRYVTKAEAHAHGWQGGGLCEIWPGHVIGGDRFRDFGGVVPEAGRRFYEADLDEGCRARGPKRLIYSDDGAIYITTDHYRHFVAVRDPRR
jgi:hypothetical protein